MHKLPEDPSRKDPRPASELDCCGAEPLIEVYLDDELSGAERGALELHLERCDACTAELDLARRIRTELHALPPQSCPPTVTRAVLEHAEFHPSLAQRLRRFWSARQVWQPAFALLVVVAFGVGYWRQAGPPPTAPPPVADSYSEAEIAQAATEIKLALAYLGDISLKTRDQIGTEVGQRVLAPFSRSIAGALLPFPRPDPAESEPQTGGTPRNVS